MHSGYWYYYFGDKRERNLFVDDIDRDSELKITGMHIVNVANEVPLSDGSLGFLAILAWMTGIDGVRDKVSGKFARYESHREMANHGSPYDY